MSEAIGDGGTRLHPRSRVAGISVGARRLDRVSRPVLLACAATAIVVVALVVGFLVANAWPVLHDIGLGAFFGSTDWNPDAGGGFDAATGTFGALTPIGGSLVVVLMALALGVPVALAVAIVLVELHRTASERWLRPAVEVFVGVPSVVYGWLGLTTLVPLLAHLAPRGANGTGYLAAGLVLAVMIVPTVATLSADALASVPGSLREGSLSLGATPWQTIRRVVLPAARGGIIAATVLGMARAMGEALAVAMVIGDVQQLPPFGADHAQGLLRPGTTMTVTITDGINQLAVNPTGTAARFALALVLLAVVFLAITLVRLVGRRGVVA